MRHIQTILISFAVCLAGLTGNVAIAEGERLSGSAIRQALTNKRMYLATPLGGEIPLLYRANGVVIGSGKAVGLGRWLAPDDSGRWWVQGQKMCQKWQEWYDGKTFCFDLRWVGDKLHWTRDDGLSGVARVGD